MSKKNCALQQQLCVALVPCKELALLGQADVGGDVRRKEDAAAAAQRSAKAERQITDAAHKQQLTPAGTIPELAVPAGAPPQQQQQLAAASSVRHLQLTSRGQQSK
ncbi:hypothetical protein HaLaN_28256 [Haematococcus lacustris]|uniref:Uncharacterized protein n=1 Tax=Haematococcus lacustris TaxID=44745 RepID=A0A6A0AAG7_HAELA|nr:hypothetical protein HaLaN_28256 [Haematococcus lacustris]